MFTNWYNYQMRSLKHAFLSVSSSRKVYLTAFVQIRHVAFEVSLQIIHPAWVLVALWGGPRACELNPPWEELN